MADLLSQVNGERDSDNQFKVMRDKAYTHLKEAVDEIRSCGKYVFWWDENRLKGYGSRYFKNR